MQQLPDAYEAQLVDEFGRLAVLWKTWEIDSKTGQKIPYSKRTFGTLEQFKSFLIERYGVRASKKLLKEVK